MKAFLDAVHGEPFPGFEASTGEARMAANYDKAVALLRACANGAEPSPGPIVSRVEPDPATVKPYIFPPLEPLVPASEADPDPMADVPSPDAAPPLQKDDAPAIPLAPPSPIAVKKAIVLKNARSGEPYADKVQLLGARRLELIDEAGTGLVLDPETNDLTGIPVEPGDFELKLKALIDDRPAEVTLRLTVVPDPKSLWTSLPSDAADRFWKADEAFAEVVGDDLRMIAASKRGRSHAKTGGFREDDFGLSVHAGWHIAVVCDGAGSARYSREGSRLAVETVGRELPALLDQHLGGDLKTLLDQVPNGPEGEGALHARLYKTLATAAHKSVEAIGKAAADLNEPFASFSTTAIITIARRLSKSWFVAAFSIGDGGAALLDLEAGEVIPLNVPDSGEYAGQTRFLGPAEFKDYADVTKRFRYATPKRFTAIALMSDGITDPKLPTDKVFADPEAWRAFWSDDLAAAVDFSAPAAEIRDKFLAWLDFWSPGNHDDRTLAVLMPREG